MKIDTNTIIQTFKESTSIYEVMLKLHLPNKGKISKYIKRILLENEFSINDIKQKKFLKTHKLIKCKYCGKEFYTLKANTKIYCSHSCANHDRKHTFESKEKIKRSLTKYKTPKICPICGKEFYKKTITCCSKCGHIYRVKYNPIKEETRKKLSLQIQKRVKEGKHKGWTTRNIESYPEKFFKKVLENNNIDYEFNKPITKNELGIQENGCYFLDFALKNNIDLEIDGKQHLVKERHQHDIVRDNRLKKNGWKVYRIAWKALPKNNEYIKNEIDKFIEWYNIIQRKEGNYDNN